MRRQLVAVSPSYLLSLSTAIDDVISRPSHRVASTNVSLVVRNIASLRSPQFFCMHVSHLSVRPTS